MNRIILLIVLLGMGLMSCEKEKTQRQLTNREIKQKIDSIVTERTKQLEEEGRTDYVLRYKIEVKAKADSILKARKKAGDTVGKVAQPVVPNMNIPPIQARKQQ